jgi:hypothetical protein
VDVGCVSPTMIAVGSQPERIELAVRPRGR